MAIEPIKGFYVHDEETDTDGVAKVSIEAVQEFEDDIRDETRKWLDDHPEATTPVEDGVITKAKINTAFLPEIKNGYITPQMYGAKGDGTADDTDAVQTALDNANFNLGNRSALFFPSGTYRITRTLNAGRSYLFGHKNAVLSFENGTGIVFSNSYESFVKELTFVASVVGSGTALAFDNCSQFKIESVNVNGFNIGLATSDTDIVNVERPSIQNCKTGVQLHNAAGVNFSEGNFYGNEKDFSFSGSNDLVTISNSYLENSGDCIVADVDAEACLVYQLDFADNMLVRNSQTQSTTQYADAGRFLNLRATSNPLRIAKINITGNRFYFNNSVSALGEIDYNGLSNTYARLNFNNNSVTSANGNITSCFTSLNKNGALFDELNAMQNVIPSGAELSNTMLVSEYPTLKETDDIIAEKLNGYSLKVSPQFTATADANGRVITNVPFYDSVGKQTVPLAVIESSRAGWTHLFGYATTVSQQYYFFRATSSSDNTTPASGDFTCKIVYLAKD